MIWKGGVMVTGFEVKYIKNTETFLLIQRKEENLNSSL